MSARQNKKAVHPYHHPRTRNTRERERTVTTLTDSAFISDTSTTTTTTTTTRAATCPTNTSIPASLGTPTTNSNHHSFHLDEYTPDTMIPSLLSSPEFLAALQNSYGNGFYNNNQNHEHYDPQDPNFAIHANYQPNMYMQPAEPSDLAILEELKATIKEGQHPMFRPEPRPAVLRALWQGAHPDSGLPEPTQDKGKGREKLTELPDGPTNEISMSAPSPTQRNGFVSRGSVSSNSTHLPPLSTSTSKQPKSDDKPPLLEPNDRDHSSRRRDSQRHSNAPARYDREDAVDRDAREKERDRERRQSTAEDRNLSSTRPTMDDRHYEPPPPSSVSEYSRRPLDDRRPLHFEDRERERERERRPMLEERDRRPSVDRRPLSDDRERRSSVPTPAPASSRVDDRRDDRDRRPLPTRIDDRRVTEGRKPLQDERRPVLLDDRPLPVDTSRVVDEKRLPPEDRRVEERRPPVDEHRLPAVDVRRPPAEDRRPLPPSALEDRRDDRRPVPTDRGSLDDRRLAASDDRRPLDDRHPVRPLDDHRPLPLPPAVDRRALVDDRRPPPTSAPPTSSPAGSADASRPVKLEERISRVPTLRERLKTPPPPPSPAVVAPQAAIPLEQRITESEDPIPRTQSTATNVPPPTTTTSPPTRSYNRPASPTRASYTRPASVPSRSPPPPRTAYRVPPVPNNYRPAEIERERERERELREREREKERLELSSSGRFSPPTAADLARDRDRMRRKFTPPPPALPPAVFEGERRREWSANGMWDDDYYKREAERRYVPAPSPPRAAYVAAPQYVVAPTLRRGRSPSPVIPVKRAREDYDYGARYHPHDPYHPDYPPHVSYERPRSPPLPPLGYDRARAYERDRSGRYLPPSNR